MKRREFIKTGTQFALLPVLLNGLPLRSLGHPSIMESLHGAFVNTDHALVLIQMNGGNDGLNTVIPVDQYTNLSKARANVMIQQSKVLILDDVTGTGFHPAMTHMRNLFNEDKVGVIQGVGYPDQNYSHFRSTDIWNTASDRDETLNSGWVGRYLSNEFPNFPMGFPNDDMPDPLALQIGSVVSPVCQGLSVNMGMSISDPQQFYQILSGAGDPSLGGKAGKELDYIRLVAQQSNDYGKAVKKAADKATNKSTKYPAARANRLADQLKIVAQLIAGGLKTRIYIVNINGFDTHANQVAATGGTETGNHANLLGWLSEAIDAFQDDCELLGIDDRVLGMTVSEFGRRIKSNASTGTDHGASAPMFLFGKNVKGGIIGSNPTIPATVETYDNLPMQYDFRSIYATVLKEWFCLPVDEVDDVMLKTFTELPLLEDTCSTISTHRDAMKQSGDAWIQNYPNPFRSSTTIQFESVGGHVVIQVIDSQGRLVETILDDERAAGVFEVNWSAERLPAGTYYYTFQHANIRQSKPMVKL
jgi:uncharacterized protein (DUF1501 family)